MHRLSKTLLPTEKQPPADAEAVSHQLMVRAGLVRQVGAGLWTWLPAGWRVHRKVEAIIREEMEAIGCQELLMPVLQPAELWRRSGRYEEIGSELFRLQDRKDADMVLAMTHEEAVTNHVAQFVRSYRDLPFSLFHIQLKERDEPRPRAGVLRTREFIMKDAYTFDRDEAGLQEQYEQMRTAYARVYDRSGLNWYEVKSDTGMMGGKVAHEFMAPCAAGEDSIAIAGEYRANLEVAEADATPVQLPAAKPAPVELHTPGASTIDELAKQLGQESGSLLKAFPVVSEERGLVLVLLRGDHQVEEIKLSKAFGGSVRQATPEEISAQIGPPGFLGPVGLQLPVLLDAAAASASESNPDGGWVIGANKVDYHLTDVVPGRDFQFEVADVRRVVEGDTVAGEPIRIESAIEIGNIFQLMTRYSEPLGAKYLDQDGKEQPIVMGSYGIGLARIVASAAEQFNDDRGISWPKAIAPYEIEVVALGKAESDELAAAEKLASELEQAGFEVLLDDRDAGPGAKLADAELLGCPLRLTIGKRSLAEGQAEAQIRRGTIDVDGGIEISNAVALVKDLWEQTP